MRYGCAVYFPNILEMGVQHGIPFPFRGLCASLVMDRFKLCLDLDDCTRLYISAGDCPLSARRSGWFGRDLIAGDPSISRRRDILY